MLSTCHSEHVVFSGDWMYRPTSKPHLRLEPAFMVQMQLQMHATGAKVAYLVSWARMGLGLFKVEYNGNFVIAAAKVLQLVMNRFVLKDEDVTADTLNLSRNDPALRDSWKSMHRQLCASMGSSTKIDLHHAGVGTSSSNTGSEMHAPMLSDGLCRLCSHSAQVCQANVAGASGRV